MDQRCEGGLLRTTIAHNPVMRPIARAACFPLLLFTAVFLWVGACAAAEGIPIPRRFVSTRQWEAGGHKIRYKVVAADTFLVDEHGQPNAALFSFAYLKDLRPAEQAKRPVMFVFNGGPGSASLWLHLGTFGPRRVRLTDPIHPPTTPPFELEDNPYWIIEAADIVLIDPVGTGFSRPVGQGKLEQFTGRVADAMAVTQFIETWTRENRRWNSPKFLVGESYGAVRVMMVANMLMGGATGPTRRLSAVTLNGLVLLGQGAVLPEDPELGYVTALPSLAAAAWYHGKAGHGVQSVEEFFTQAQHFAEGDYRNALFAGDRLPDVERSRIAETMAGLIGLPVAEILDRNLRIDTTEFRALLLKSEEAEVGLYDSRYTYRQLTPFVGTPDIVADDPAMGQFTPSFVAAFNEYVRDELGVAVDERYEPISFDVYRKFEQNGSGDGGKPAQNLAATMRRNPRLRLFVGCGYYDLISTAGNSWYQFAHMGLPFERVVVRNYPAGHMLYLGDTSSARLAEDLTLFIAGAQ